MKYKKFLLIPVLFYFYLFFVVSILASFNPSVYSHAAKSVGVGGVQTIGIGQAVSVSVIRPYFFGMIRLPVYTTYLGNIGGIHQTFFNLLILMTLAFAVIEWKNIGTGISMGGGSFRKLTAAKSTASNFQWRGEQMSAYKLKEGESNLKDLAKIFGLGVGFGLLIYILTLDGGVSTGLGLLLMYLEYKLK